MNRPVIVHLSSMDMVHSFALPEVRVKQDAIPGIAQPVWSTPMQTGKWEIACSQLCGLGHYRMRGFYAIHTEAEYRSWSTSEATLQAAPDCTPHGRLHVCFAGRSRRVIVITGRNSLKFESNSHWPAPCSNDQQ